MPTIAIIGASKDRNKFGNKAVRAYVQKGYDVYPIHPSESEIEGCTVYRSLEDVPVGQMDRVSIYLPSAITLKVMDDLIKKPVLEYWFNPGADSEEVLDAARSRGMNVIARCSIVDIGLSPADFPA